MTKDPDKSETEDELRQWLNGFHSCALIAYVEVWQQTGQFPPDSETVRRLAYKFYEDEKRCENEDKSVPPLTA